MRLFLYWFCCLFNWFVFYCGYLCWVHRVNKYCRDRTAVKFEEKILSFRNVRNSVERVHLLVKFFLKIWTKKKFSFIKSKLKEMLSENIERYVRKDFHLQNKEKSFFSSIRFRVGTGQFFHDRSGPAGSKSWPVLSGRFTSEAKLAKIRQDRSISYSHKMVVTTREEKRKMFMFVCLLFHALQIQSNI
jgi:hypothetical protein